MKHRSPVARSGAAAVEFAAVSFVFFLFILGTVELGRALMVEHALINAARKGCRAGIPPGTSTATIRAVTADSLAGAGLQGADVSVLVNDASTEASSAANGDRLTVVTTIAYSRASWVPVRRYVSGNLTGRYTLRRE